jgi:hypothetical protein
MRLAFGLRAKFSLQQNLRAVIYARVKPVSFGLEDECVKLALLSSAAELWANGG